MLNPSTSGGSDASDVVVILGEQAAKLFEFDTAVCTRHAIVC